MLNCPTCNQPLQDDPNNPGKVLCYHCRKRYDKAKVEQYWAIKQPVSAPVQAPAGEPPVPVAAPVQQSQAPYGAAPAPQQPAYNPNVPTYGTAPAPRLPKGMSVAALVLGIIAVLNCWLPIVNIIAIVFGIIALVLGIVGMNKAKKGTAGGKGMSIAGIVTGALAIVFSVAISALFVVGLGAAMNESGITYEDVMNEIENSQNIALDEDFSYSSDSDPAGSTEPAFNDASPWTSLSFKLGGQDFQLMQTTLAQLEASGWGLDLAAQGYPDGYNVEPQQMISVISLSNPVSEASVYVNVANLDEMPKSIKDCVVSKISFDTFGEPSDMFSLEGIQCGASPDEVKAKFGEPQDTYGDTAEYLDWGYETSDYSKYMDLTFTDNMLSEISITSLDY